MVMIGIKACARGCSWATTDREIATLEEILSVVDPLRVTNRLRLFQVSAAPLANVGGVRAGRRLVVRTGDVGVQAETLARGQQCHQRPVGRPLELAGDLPTH